MWWFMFCTWLPEVSCCDFTDIAKLSAQADIIASAERSDHLPPSSCCSFADHVELEPRFQDVVLDFYLPGQSRVPARHRSGKGQLQESLMRKIRVWEGCWTISMIPRRLSTRLQKRKVYWPRPSRPPLHHYISKNLATNGEKSQLSPPIAVARREGSQRMTKASRS